MFIHPKFKIQKPKTCYYPNLTFRKLSFYRLSVEIKSDNDNDLMIEIKSNALYLLFLKS